MAQFVKIECYGEPDKEISFEVPWWNPPYLLEKYNFKEVEFAGEIDYELEVGKGTLKQIQLEQKQFENSYLFKPDISKRIDILCDYYPPVKIIIRIYTWYSGY